MDVQSAYGILGIDSSVPLDKIKSTYRSLAKKYHLDKNNSNESTALFRQLNHAYQTLIKCHIYAGHDGDSTHAGPVCVDSMSDITLHTKENTFSVTIDITDIMFLVILGECESYHGVSPVDRGVNGQQMKFPYTSPGESEHYCSISLTFYPTAFRLLVQGSSYFLWVDQHLPTICKQAELRYVQNASTWTASARRRGIRLKRERHPTRHSRSMRSSRLDNLSSPNDLLAHTSELEDPPLPEILGTTTATCSLPGVERSSSPAAVGIGPPARTVHMSCEAEDTSSIGDPSPTTEGNVTAMHSDQATAVKAPMTSKKTKCPKKKTAAKKRRKKLWIRSIRDTVTLNAKSPLPPTWYAVHCVWFGFMSNVPARTLTTRVSGVVTHAARCPNLFRAWPKKLNF